MGIALGFFFWGAASKSAHPFSALLHICPWKQDTHHYREPPPERKVHTPEGNHAVP